MPRIYSAADADRVQRSIRTRPSRGPTRLDFGDRVQALGIAGEIVLAIHGVVAHKSGPNHVKIRCPSHSPDTTPSCSVNLRTGRAHCFGCDFRAGDVVALHRALGNFASMGDALRDLERRSGSPVPRLELRPAIAAQRGNMATPAGDPIEVRRWTYHTASGAAAFDVVRLQFRLADGSWQIDAEKGKPSKQYRPAAPGSSRWGMPEPYASGALRPLYRLREILASPADALIVVVEGEPPADALTGVGILATTSSGGASNPQRTDWLPLAGRRVVLWPDNDDAGRRYATAVTTTLMTLDPAALIQWVAIDELNLPAGGDAVDWIARTGGKAK